MCGFSPSYDDFSALHVHLGLLLLFFLFAAQIGLKFVYRGPDHRVALDSGKFADAGDRQSAALDVQRLDRLIQCHSFVSLNV
jgi:hypothetical protein